MLEEPPLTLRLSSVEGLADVCARFHDFPFELDAQQFDADARTWTALFLRGSHAPARLVTRRWFGLFKVVEFPIIQVSVTIHNVIEAEIRDRAQIGWYTFRQVHRTASGCSFEFHQDCDIYVDVDGRFEADVRDVGELTGMCGRIVSVGVIDFGIEIGPVRETGFGDFQ